MKRTAGERAAAALLVVDVINRFDFEGGTALLRASERIARKLGHIMDRARAADVPVIYCNDHFGQWRSDFRALFDACAGEEAAGSAFVQAMQPAPTDYFMLKPKHSAFLATPLDLLLQSLGVGRLLIAGLAADSCILATALDAHARDYDAAVAADAVASQTPARTRKALDILRTASAVRTPASRAALRWLGAAP